MSTLLTAATVPAVTEASLASQYTPVDPTAATEPALDIESIKQLLDGFDPASLLPELSEIFTSIQSLCRIAVLIGPIVMLVLGLAYLFFSPKEANYYFGYRCYFGMGSVQAWRFTQRLAGAVLGGVGLVLLGVAIFLGGSFMEMEAMDVVWKAAGILVWQAVLAVLANLAISLAASIRFDRKGEYRNKKKR